RPRRDGSRTARGVRHGGARAHSPRDHRDATRHRDGHGAFAPSHCATVARRGALAPTREDPHGAAAMTHPEPVPHLHSATRALLQRLPRAAPRTHAELARTRARVVSTSVKAAAVTKAAVLVAAVLGLAAAAVTARYLATSRHRPQHSRAVPASPHVSPAV